MASPEPQDPSWIPTAPIQIKEQATIAAAPDVVWAHLADNEGWVDWFPGFKKCHFVSNEPYGLGSHRLVHQDQFKVEERIIAWEPSQRWGMTVIEINAPVIAAMAEEAILTEEAGGTRIEFTIGVELTRFGRLIKGPLISKSTKGLKTALQQLGERCATS